MRDCDVVQAAEAWKKATEEEKAPHVAAAEQEKEVYEKLSSEYEHMRDAATKQQIEALARSMISSQVSLQLCQQRNTKGKQTDYVVT